MNHEFNKSEIPTLGIYPLPKTTTYYPGIACHRFNGIQCSWLKPAVRMQEEYDITVSRIRAKVHLRSATSRRLDHLSVLLSNVERTIGTSSINDDDLVILDRFAQ
ncbi:MAG: hypothetical protein QGG53_21280 [Planctomycetota bacterium]|nr:hypothetical protein [Planctomycetota bacterium]